MGKATTIGWTHHTFNAWWGCVEVSPGCANCYARMFAERTGHKVWGEEAPRRFFGDKHWAEPIGWNASAQQARERRRVFCQSMGDLFEDRPDLVEPRARLFRLVEETPWLDWLLLTKRAENMVRLSSPYWPERWPDNAWAGCTTEDQRRLDERAPRLLDVNAPVHFLSMEPLLGPIDARAVFRRGSGCECDQSLASSDRCANGWIRCNKGLRRVRWAIVGGESSAKRRAMDVAWMDRIAEDARQADVALYVKQDADLRPGQQGRISLPLWERKEFPCR